MIVGVDTDTGNVFCHLCGDYIYDPTLEAIQRSKRIILGKRKRDAEQVRVINGADTQSSSQTLRPIYSSANLQKYSLPNSCLIVVAGLRGIQNLGNTCYMSSILQSFIHNPIVRNHYLSDSHNANLCTRTNCIHCTINTVFSDMYIFNPSRSSNRIRSHRFHFHNMENRYYICWNRSTRFP